MPAVHLHPAQRVPGILAAVLFCAMLTACGGPTAADASLDGGEDSSALDGGAPLDAMPAPGADATADGVAEPSPELPDAQPGDAGAGVVPTVELSLGDVRGRAEGTTHVFEGIPYAMAPVGARRFALPEPAEAWEAELDATRPGSVCPQLGEGAPEDPRTGLMLEESEDCLTLNVYAPAETPAEGAPVMVFLHGGSGNTGAGSLYDGRPLSEAGGVVVVTLNYRLGTLAWLVHPDLDEELGTTSGNLGLRDQQLALRWVRSHIEVFGGNPDNVTLFGQSHGASCACFHMFLSGSEGLAHRFILQSGGCVGTAVAPGTREGMEARSAALIEEVCNARSDVATCLREQDAKGLATLGAPGLPLENAQGFYVDGDLLRDSPRTLLGEGDYAHAPVLLGSTLRESHFLASEHFGGDWPLVANTPALAIGLSAMYPDDWLAILEQYGVPSDANANDTMVSVMDDSWMRCSTRALGLAAASQGDDIYLYSFELPPAVHIQDLDYVFGLDESPWSQVFEGAPVPLVHELVAEMQGYWSRFAHSGDPNGGGAPPWPVFTPEEDRHLVLDRDIRTGQRHLRDECEFWAGTTAGGH